MLWEFGWSWKSWSSFSVYFSSLSTIHKARRSSCNYMTTTKHRITNQWDSMYLSHISFQLITFEDEDHYVGTWGVQKICMGSVLCSLNYSAVLPFHVIMCIVLYCTVLYCAVLRCMSLAAMLHVTALHYTVICTVLYYTV